MFSAAWKQLPKLLCLFAALFFLQLAKAGTVTLVLGDKEGPHREFADSFQEHLKLANWSIIARDKYDALDFGKGSDLYITTGADALVHLLGKKPGKPVIATLITRSAYEKALAETPHKGRITAIYLDQPTFRQSAFIRQILPSASRVGLLARRDQQVIVQQYRNALSAQNQTLDVEETESPTTFQPAVNALLPRVDVLLALPDPRTINRDQLRPLLITALRYQKPVIAYSLALVNSGALAAIYSTPTQFGQQTADLVNALGDQLPSPQYPGLYTIAINRAVAEAFGVEVRDESLIRRALSRTKDSQ